MSSDSRMTAEAGMYSERAREKLPITLSATSFLYGPWLSDPTSGETSTTWKNQNTGITIQNQIALQYRLTEDIAITPVFDFEIVMTDPYFEYKRDQYLALSYDSFVRVNHTNLLNFRVGEHDAWLSGDFRFYVPTSEYSRDNNGLGSLRVTLSPGIQFRNSNFSIAWVNFARYWVQTQDFLTGTSSIALPRLMFYTGPLVNYQASDKLAFWMLFEGSMTYDTQGVPNTRQPNRSLVDIEPGMDFRIGRNITISPYLNWFVNQPLDTTSINLTANITI